MAIVKKTVPYEILLRFSEGAAHQLAPAGALEGAHYIEQTLLIDEESGEQVAPPQKHPALRIPQEKMLAFFGENAAAFHDGFAALSKTHDEIVAAHNALAAANEDLRQQLDLAMRQISGRSVGST